ncbi:MAG: class I SAM-dependent methyltransferase [archaeon]
MKSKNRVCPLENSGSLESTFRKLIHNPKKILKPYLHSGMKVLDFGCGPGLFTIEAANQVGEKGKVIAADLQQGMLDKVKNKIKDKPYEKRIKLIKTQSNNININEKVDFVLAFYVVHEFPTLDGFFRGIKEVMKADSKLLVIEPSFHVSKKEFKDTLNTAQRLGFKVISNPKFFLSRAVLLNLQ